MEYRQQENCKTCGELSGNVNGSVLMEAPPGAARPRQIGWCCSKGHENLYPPPPRTPLHQGAVYLDEVASLVKASEDEVCAAVEDGLLQTGFDGNGVWLGDLMRWERIRRALAACEDDEKRDELREALVERLAITT
ncbi:MAG TPA: hypothetical protein VMS11_07305 [Solirubrobacterales bacterium]|nr:hypothetical protein [Solirubrobacterales bacterium]